MLTDFQYKLALLDAFLTGHSWADVSRTARQRAASPGEFVEGSGDTAYYLSDGGYSRVACDPFTHRLFLTSNSLEGPKEMWAKAGKLLTDVQAAVDEWAQANGWTHSPA